MTEDLKQQLREYYEERAAILEFDGNLSKEEAEKQAYAETEQYWLGLKDDMVL